MNNNNKKHKDFLISRNTVSDLIWWYFILFEREREIFSSLVDFPLSARKIRPLGETANSISSQEIYNTNQESYSVRKWGTGRLCDNHQRSQKYHNRTWVQGPALPLPVHAGMIGKDGSNTWDTTMWVTGLGAVGLCLSLCLFAIFSYKQLNK